MIQYKTDIEVEQNFEFLYLTEKWELNFNLLTLMDGDSRRQLEKLIIFNYIKRLMYAFNETSISVKCKC